MKYYLDTSSVVKIYHPEEGSKESLELYRGSSALRISELSVLEFISVVCRKLRENDIDSKTADELVLKFREDIETRYELLGFSPLVFEEASRVLEIYGKSHALRTLDSLQFAFFLAYCEKDDVFVCSDKRLTSVVTVDDHKVLFPTGVILPEASHEKAKGTEKLFLSPPHMGGEELAFVKKAFKSNYIAPLGPMVDAFETEFADYVGIRHCAAVSSGTAAMHLGLRHLLQRSEVGSQRSEVFVSTLTFIGGVTPVVFQGADPVFIDCDRESWNMDPILLETELERCHKNGKLPAAVAPTDLYGQCCDLGRIAEVCDRYGVPVICDSAESLGARFQKPEGEKTEKQINKTDRRNPASDLWCHAGCGARAAVYSFNGNKIITTSGGGMLASDDEGLIKHAKKLSEQAREDFPHYEHEEIGYNYRMSNVLAAIGRGQLKVLDEGVKRKREIFNYYQDALRDLAGIEFMPEPEWSKSNRWLTVILITPEEFGVDREQVRVALGDENIEARPVWKPMHLQPVFCCRGQKSEVGSQKGKQRYSARVVGGQVAEDLFERGLCLPSGTAMRDSDLDRVIDTILNCHKKSQA